MMRALEHHLRPEVKATPFCPGCGTGSFGADLRTIDELEWASARCSSCRASAARRGYRAPTSRPTRCTRLHGRAVAFATGVKLANPDLKVMVVSGDGDLTSIGGNHLIHAARRRIDLTVLCANNPIYGMTGGQVAPTTPKGARSATTAEGNPYPPFDLCKLVKAAGATYVARGSVLQPYQLMDQIGKALQTPAFSFVEVSARAPRSTAAATGSTRRRRPWTR